MRRWVVGAAVAVAVAGSSLGAAWWLLAGDSSEGSSPTTGTLATTGSVTVTGEGTGSVARAGAADGDPVEATAPQPTVDPATLVHLDDVWLLDGGDGAYDWGIVLEGGDGARRDIDVTVRLLDATGSVVFTGTDSLSVLGAHERSALGGTARSLPAQPVRIEADVSVGFDADDPSGGVAGTVDVRAVERRSDPRSDDGSEVVAGRLRSTFPGPVENLLVAAIWRAPIDDGPVRAGDIVAVVFRDVERVRPGIDARFEIPTTGRNVPDGAPDEVLVAM